MPEKPDPQFEIPSLHPLERETAAVSYLQQEASYGALAEVVRKHTDRLMAIDGVVMVAQGQDEVGRDCITVGVKTVRDLHKIPKIIDGSSGVRYGDR